MVSRDSIQALVDDIAAAFEVEKVILFGSHAHGTPRQDSDVDLLVVMPFVGSELERAVAVANEVNPAFSCDLLLMHPAETAPIGSIARTAHTGWGGAV